MTTESSDIFEREETYYLTREELDKLIIECHLDNNLKLIRIWGSTANYQGVSLLQFVNKTRTFQVLFRLLPEELKITLLSMSKRMNNRFDYYSKLCQAKENNHDKS